MKRPFPPKQENGKRKWVVTEVRDNRRRGNPLPGCDCVQCFGYCIVDQDLRARLNAQQQEDKP